MKIDVSRHPQSVLQIFSHKVPCSSGEFREFHFDSNWIFLTQFGYSEKKFLFVYPNVKIPVGISMSIQLSPNVTLIGLRELLPKERCEFLDIRGLSQMRLEGHDRVPVMAKQVTTGENLSSSQGIRK